MGESNHITTSQPRPKSKQHQPPCFVPDKVAKAILSIFESRVIDILPALGFLSLTYNVVEALTKANGDCGTISFVICSHANLIALFFCLKSFHRGESPKKKRLKFTMWILVALLKLFFSYRVTSILVSIVMSMTSKDHLSFVFDGGPSVMEEPTTPRDEPKGGRRGGFATKIKNKSGGAIAIFLLATSLALLISSPTGKENPTHVEAVRNLFNVMAFFSGVVLVVFTVSLSPPKAGRTVHHHC